jgi:hypothetical protein
MQPDSRSASEAGPAPYERHGDNGWHRRRAEGMGNYDCCGTPTGGWFCHDACTACGATARTHGRQHYFQPPDPKADLRQEEGT